MQNVFSLVMALSFALDGSWWCFTSSLIVMVGSAHIFLGLAWGLLKRLLVVEAVLCCYLPRSNKVSLEKVAHTIRDLEHSSKHGAEQHSLGYFKALASDILRRTKEKQKSVDRPAWHWKYLERQRILIGESLYVVPLRDRRRSSATHPSKLAKREKPGMTMNPFASIRTFQDVMRRLCSRRSPRVCKARTLNSTKLTRRLIYYKMHSDTLLCPADRK